MEKIELQQIIPYLPYRLKMISTAGGKSAYDRTEKRRLNKVEELKISNLELLIFLKRKPILRHLSDLQKDEFFDLYLDLCEELEVTQCKNMLTALENGQYYAMDIQKYKIMETFLSKHHFDWKYGLIEKGLAVDINTL